MAIRRDDAERFSAFVDGLTAAVHACSADLTLARWIADRLVEQHPQSFAAWRSQTYVLWRLGERQPCQQAVVKAHELAQQSDDEGAAIRLHELRTALFDEKNWTASARRSAIAR